MNIPIPEVLWLWGPGVFILILGYLMFNSFAKYIGKNFLNEFLESQRRQAAAIETLCTAIAGQQKDEDFTRREIMLVLKIMGQKLDDLSTLKESPPHFEGASKK